MTPEEAEKEWDIQSQEFYFKSIISSPGSYKQGIKDFKSALREEIEKEMISRGVSGHYADGRTWAFKRTLELLDSLTPKK